MPVSRKTDPVAAPGRVLRFHPADTSAPVTLSPEQVRHYNEQGFIAPLDVLTADEVTSLRGYIDDLLAVVLGADDPRNSYSINTYHLVCAGLWDVATDPRIVACVRDILGDNVVCWGTHLFAKLPGDGKSVPLHQDAVYWPLTPSKTATVWLAIDDSDVDNAAMQFVPGTHLAGPLEHDEIGLDGTRVLKSQVRDSDRFTARYLNALRAGQASVHSDLLLHGSDANRSLRRRAGLTLRYAATDVRLIDGYDDWRKTAVHVAGGDPSGFWYDRRRPNGEHPERMAAFYGEFDGQPLDAG